MGKAQLVLDGLIKWAVEYGQVHQLAHIVFVSNSRLAEEHLQKYAQTRGRGSLKVVTVSDLPKEQALDVLKSKLFVNQMKKEKREKKGERLSGDTSSSVFSFWRVWKSLRSWGAHPTYIPQAEELVPPDDFFSPEQLESIERAVQVVGGRVSDLESLSTRVSKIGQSGRSVARDD